jgi:hypothetical protein
MVSQHREGSCRCFGEQHRGPGALEKTREELARVSLVVDHEDS